MCGTGAEAPSPAVLPRPAEGPAVDPIRLEPVDEVRITTIVDNVFDGLLVDGRQVTRAQLGAYRPTARQFDLGATYGGLRAEHGFAALVQVRRGERSWTLLFDTGLTPDAMVDNADRIEVDLGSIQAVVLSHGHFDHAGGLQGLGDRLGPARMPLVLHPFAFTPRRVSVPGGPEWAMPTLTRTAVEAEGFQVVERAQPALLLDGSVLLTGEVDRVTDFEHGMPPVHQALLDGVWQHDAAVPDDQALVVHVRGRGLVVLTGCGHAGVVNLVRQAMRLTGVDRLAGVVGGFHLSGPFFEPVIAPTVAALTELAPGLVVPGHCTGFAAQARLAAALPDAFVVGSSGSSYRVAAG